MTHLDDWQDGNDEYLAAAVDWVRLLLERERGPQVIRPVPEVRWFQRKRPPVADVPCAKDLNDAAARVTAAGKIDPPPALLILGQRLGLSRFEREILLLCAAVELDTRIAGLCAYAQDNPNRPYPTFALAMALFDDPAWEALSPERPLRRLRLVEINQPGAQALTTSPLRADERIVNFIKGLNYLDDRLAPLLAPFDVAEEREDSNDKTPDLAPALPPSQAALATAIVQTLRRPAGQGRLPIIQLAGPDSLSKQLIAGRAANTLERTLLRLPAESLPAQIGEVETLARLWERESALLPIVLYLDAQEVDERGDSEKGGEASLVHRFLSRCKSATILASRESWLGLGPASLLVDVDKPTPVEQRAAWNEILGELEPDLPARLAGQFNLNLPAIHQVVQDSLPSKSGEDRSLAECIWDACLVRTRPRLDVLAQRIDAMATWDDIVLPKNETLLLRQLADQVAQRSKVYDEWGFRQKMNRGLGISALFAGESGTGKTMAAEVLANDLRLNLYRIDLSAVISKYIGETEKNLRRLFDAAEDGGAILFFDEADALFGKRSEVKDSHDRYANIEINYLLQRMEAYRGLAVLATNMKSALDHALLRRLRSVINFPFPGQADRAHIWRRVFPPQTPLNGLDFDFLARLNLAGGHIHNVALNAAFRAAKSGEPVSMSLVLEAARYECNKIGQAVNESFFKYGH